MKYKIIAFIGGIALCTGALAESCAGGAGTVVTGADGTTTYCASNITMNWWSAFAWCDAIEMQLIDLTQECNKVTGTTACPQFTGVGVSNVWTRNVDSNTNAYVITSTGGLNRNYQRNTNPCYALCK